MNHLFSVDGQDTSLLCRLTGGSRLYGTQRADSDYDLRGVCYTPTNTLLGFGKFKQYESKFDNYDIVYYSLNRFFELACANNPNILDILFAPEDVWLYNTKNWLRIYSIRKAFLSVRVLDTFLGYARGQYKKIKLRTDGIYDTKDAMHCYRLLSKIEDILLYGDYNPVLTDNQLVFAKAILNGEFDIDYLIGWADERFAEVNGSKMSLPFSPDYNIIEPLLMELNFAWLKGETV